jgi:hypothetical protein
MRGFAVFAVVVAVLAAGSAAASPSRTALTVTYWEKGRAAGGKTVWTVACSPARGTLTHPAVGCRRLAVGGRKLFAPVPKDAVCTEIYGGPQEALVVGNVRGQRVWARFARRNGCEIARWSRISPWLLPPGGVS